jgi:Na+-transporting methylmalonyl-CoA/oxaloacetate decarboxylase gamma subunit
LDFDLQHDDDDTPRRLEQEKRERKEKCAAVRSWRCRNCLGEHATNQGTELEFLEAPRTWVWQKNKKKSMQGKSAGMVFSFLFLTCAPHIKGGEGRWVPRIEKQEVGAKKKSKKELKSKRAGSMSSATVAAAVADVARCRQ